MMEFMGGAPLSKFALVTNYVTSNVTPLNLANPLAPVAAANVAVGSNPYGIAISPDGLFALVANYGTNNVTPLNLANPLAPVAAANVAVGGTPHLNGPTMIYFRTRASL